MELVPRSVRIQYAGAVYHVMSRGDRREAIFVDDQDRENFLHTLAQMCARGEQRVHSYVLMSNHYHLLLETPEANLVAGMQWLQGTYTQRHNARHRHCGHLFQGRYKAIPVESAVTDYLRAVSEYIHLNPVRARILAEDAPDLLAYPWSSFPVFAREARMPVWLCRERIFESLGLRGAGAVVRRRYADWMAERTRETLARTASEEEALEWRELRRGWYLGSERFRDRLEDWAGEVMAGRRRASYGREESLGRHDLTRAEELLREGFGRLELSLEQVAGLKQSDVVKQGLAWWVKSQTMIGDAWIGDRLQMGHRSNVSRAVAAFRAPADSKRRKLRKLLHICTP